MKRFYSLLACFLVCAVMLQYRVVNSDLSAGQPPLKITMWDAFGYYVYLPSIFIYHDCRELKWLPAIDEKYNVTGGNGWQAEKLPDGRYTFKYLGGVAILQLPFFALAHLYATHSHYPPDGFSPPYQYALGFGIIFWLLLGILLLRKILLLYFSDVTTAITLLMLCLATNAIQYAAIDNGQSHAYIFPLYVLVLYATIRWHARPSALWATLTGYIVGLAAICRPTEAIMVFIPIFWATQNKEAARAKWQLAKDHKRHIYLAALGGVLGMLPQLIYWKYTTGGWLFDVGSKWDFLNPHFRVLFGWEKGWFIYTPVTIFFIAGMFFIRSFPFRKSVLWFCLLNIYIIIAWHDWRYGGSYSTRALMQSYPLFALPFAALTEHISRKKWKPVFYLLCAYLLIVNCFQETQYCSTVLHYDDMNRRYYARIYLNPAPTPADMSLLDSNDFISSEASYHSKPLYSNSTPALFSFTAWGQQTLLEQDLAAAPGERWLRVDATIKAPGCLWQTFLHADLVRPDTVSRHRVRLFRPLSRDDSPNDYTFYVHVTDRFAASHLKVYLGSSFNFSGTVERLAISSLTK